MLLSIGCGLVISLIVVLNTNGRDPDELLRDARNALAMGEFEESLSLSQELLGIESQHADALLIAGEACVRLSRYEDAATFYQEVPATAGESHVTAQFAAAEVLRHLGRLREAETCLNRVVDAAPQHGAAHERLGLLLESRGQHWLARVHWRAAVAQQRFSMSSLRLLADSEGRFEPPATADGKTSQDDLMDAIQAMAQQDREEATRLITRVLKAEPDNVEAHFRRGLLLADESPEELAAWNRQLPADAEEHPGIWRVRGLWSQHSKQPDAAMRCYWESIRRDPTDRTSTYQLAQLIQHTEQSESSVLLTKRADALLRLSVLMNRLEQQPNDVISVIEITRVLETIDRRPEAAAWCRLALSMAPARRDLPKRVERLTAENPETPASHRTLASLDLSHLPLPVWSDDSHAGTSVAQATAQIRFRDRAEETGLEFHYRNGHDADAEGMKMYSFTGGGIGVIDFDHDGWPDVACTQGGDWTDRTSQQFNDRLFRNYGGESFEDSSLLAGIDAPGFSQGIACGDINNDGWADLYVARIGRNILYVNNGDGTFTEATDSIGPTVERWTTSCLIADLDGDGNSDILDMNYLKGDDVFDRLCDYGGHERTCVPAEFAFERDDLWINDGQGVFELADAAAGFSAEPRPALGAIAADFDGSGRLGVFVANDALANWFYRLDRVEGVSIRLEETASRSGVGVDRDGRAQACMGIACSDADGNGELDLFVTNYYQESNTLYLSRDGAFVDAARDAGLFAPSLAVLGFGTQFLDADLDGWEDLIVANGHVDDFRFDDIPFRMPAQFFRNQGKGVFAIHAPEPVGPYFQRKTLGRSAACLDWNRDGRPDVAIMHLDSPVALLTNESADAGRALSVRLVATQSQRDAYGTQVTVQLDSGASITRQLVAGSGYQAANEPVLIFGLGRTASVTEVNVRWPSGETTTISTSVQPGSELVLVEGADGVAREP